MRKSAIDIWVGIFVAIGLLAALFLALKVGNMNAVSFAPTYKISARFDNIGGLKPRAPVKSAGVVVGRIANISFDKKPGDTEGKEVVTLSKSEAVKKLNTLTADYEAMGKLQKSDRDKISQYILGTVPQTEISHLLK